jgi:hypothetical protein
MIKITKDTFQKLLLTELSGESKKPGDLYIFVESLPLFLSTSIAFKIFNYQLRNFPRRVIWASTEEKILHLMRLGELPLKDNLSIEQIKAIEEESAKPKELPSPTFVDISQEVTTTNIHIQAMDGNEKKDSGEDYSFTEFTGSSNNPHNEKNTELAKISLKHLFEQGDYNPSSLIEAEENQSNIINTGKTIQDLDSWIERIEATKKALNSMKSDYHDELDVVQTPVKQSSIPVLPIFSLNKDKKKQPQAYLFITSFFAFALIFILVMVFFPTSVYTLEIKPAEDSATINLSIPSSSFTKQVLQLSANATIPTSGDDISGTQRATGKVDLINKSSKTVNLTNGSFSILRDGRRYTHLRNTTLPNIITLSPFNEKSPVSISIQANEPGPDYNQSVDSTFEILNELGQKPCASCFGVATTRIQAGDGSGKKIVSEADQSLLRATVDGALAQQRVSKLQEIKDDKQGVDTIIINNDWYRNISSNYVFSPDLGQPATETALKAGIESEVYYLPKATVDELLQRENKEVDKVTDLSVLDSVGKFEDATTDIKLKISYRFTKVVDLDKVSIEKSLKTTKDFTKAKEEVQKNYQSVSGIEKKDLGLQIPGISPFVNVKFIQKN